ncbi:MAG: hypothetical protein WCV58_00470 [Patescibacteria group bacterium]
MKEIPQLDQQQLNQWKEKILGANSKKFPESFLFEQLFFERSPLSREKNLSERIEVLIRKYPKADTRKGLQAIFPNALTYLRDNDFLDEKTYEEEHDKCMKLIFGEN